MVINSQNFNVRVRLWQELITAWLLNFMHDWLGYSSKSSIILT